MVVLLALLVSAAEAQPPSGGSSRSVWMKPLVKQYDDNKDGRVDGAERTKVIEWIREEMEKKPPRLPGNGGGEDKAWCESRKIDKASAVAYADRPLYDTGVIRTVFIDFPQKNWDEEMALLWRTKICTPATVTVDGKVYPDAGIRYRGTSSFFTVLKKKKKSFSVSLDWKHSGQELPGGYRSFNLLSGHADPTFMRTMLFSRIAGGYLKMSKAAFVHLVVNGESWGLYINDQPLNKKFTDEAFGTRRGARWKVPPNFNGESALAFQGDAADDYADKYLLKSATSKSKAWKALAKLCKTLSKASPKELEETLSRQLDVVHTLWFLAIDNVLMDGDGYHYRGSDYAIYMHPNGRFYPMFRDNNEAFSYGGGPGGFGREGERSKRSRSLDRDPLYRESEERAALCHALFRVPKWREQYLENCRRLAADALDWAKVGPLVDEWRAMIEPLVKIDDKALYGHEAFVKGLDQGTKGKPGLKKFFQGRREFLVGCAALEK